MAEWAAPPFLLNGANVAERGQPQTLPAQLRGELGVSPDHLSPRGRVEGTGPAGRHARSHGAGTCHCGAGPRQLRGRSREEGVSRREASACRPPCPGVRVRRGSRRPRGGGGRGGALVSLAGRPALPRPCSRGRGDLGKRGRTPRGRRDARGPVGMFCPPTCVHTCHTSRHGRLNAGEFRSRGMPSASAAGVLPLRPLRVPGQLGRLAVGHSQ